jgi:hypothetical protein
LREFIDGRAKHLNVLDKARFFEMTAVEQSEHAPVEVRSGRMTETIPDFSLACPPDHRAAKVISERIVGGEFNSFVDELDKRVRLMGHRGSLNKMPASSRQTGGRDV